MTQYPWDYVHITTWNFLPFLSRIGIRAGLGCALRLRLLVCRNCRPGLRAMATARILPRNPSRPADAA